MADVLAPDTIDALSQSLAQTLGPIARLLVKQASRESTDVDMLLSTLTRQCKTRGRSRAFPGRGAARPGGQPRLRHRPDRSGHLAGGDRAVTEAMLPLIGPIARVLVARHAEKAVGRDDFYGRLADCIPSERDRAKFLEIRARIAAGASCDGPLQAG